MVAVAQMPVVLLVLAALPAALGFKDHDFKTCDKLGFCKRNRHMSRTEAKGSGGGMKGPAFAMEVIENGAAFPLTLSAYSSGAVRVTMEEAEADLTVNTEIG